MPFFLSVRSQASGGPLASEVSVHDGVNFATTNSVTQLQSDVQGKHILIATHGFNVSQDQGIASLSNWDTLLNLPQPSIFLGLLWPGDSVWLHGLSYPEEPRIANEAAALIAPFIDSNFQQAASISFAAHSLGARLVLATAAKMSLRVRRCTLMAGAIDSSCLNNEFKTAAGHMGEISVLASKEDEVLALAFPIGNLLSGIIAQGHPWFHSALGRSGPSTPWPSNFRAPFQIPDNWHFGHGDYLRISFPPGGIPVPQDVPPNNSPQPAPGDSSKASWTAAFESTRFSLP